MIFHSLELADLAGGHDGSLRIWELGHEHEIATYRESGKYQRVTKVHFSQHGGKVKCLCLISASCGYIFFIYRNLIDHRLVVQTFSFLFVIFVGFELRLNMC